MTSFCRGKNKIALSDIAATNVVWMWACVVKANSYFNLIYLNVHLNLSLEQLGLGTTVPILFREISVVKWNLGVIEK